LNNILSGSNGDHLLLAARERPGPLAGPLAQAREKRQDPLHLFSFAGASARAVGAEK